MIIIQSNDGIPEDDHTADSPRCLVGPVDTPKAPRVGSKTPEFVVSKGIGHRVHIGAVSKCIPFIEMIRGDGSHGRQQHSARGFGQAESNETGQEQKKYLDTPRLARSGLPEEADSRYLEIL